MYLSQIYKGILRRMMVWRYAAPHVYKYIEVLSGAQSNLVLMTEVS